ncbi:MAG: peptidoglycan DD-metalloendopeptidase family protein [Proteobacteria bacterium]|nr:peptidoglycan DD-metalloendopeptidase family protein [Pseudomonadota bacterium]
MPQHKLTLSMSLDRRKRPFWPWVWGGIALIITAICVYALCRNNEYDRISEPDPISMAELGMQEWADLEALTRQSLDTDLFDDLPDTIPDETNTNTDPFLIKGKISRNQTLFVALKNHGLDVADIHQVIEAMQTVVDFKRTKPGDTYEVHLDVDKHILKFVYQISPEDISIAERKDNAFTAHKVDMHKKTERIYVRGLLTSSLYQSFRELGESGELASRFMQLFKYDIDFASDSQRGDEFSVLVDKVTLNGNFYKYGRVWAATYTSGARGKQLEAYYYDTDEEYAGYYDATGRALKRTFLKTPVVGCPISSPYNPKRMHPILKRIRPHNGIDWACPTGTPIMAFADGTVTFAGWKGGNGNLLVIEHAHGYTSIYAHIYAFPRNIKPGVHVKQGQTVAMVGNTGISTGPHLHFGVKINGKYVDPASIDTQYSYALTGNRLHAFSQSRDKYRLAMTEKPNKASAQQAAK